VPIPAAYKTVMLTLPSEAVLRDERMSRQQLLRCREKWLDLLDLRRFWAVHREVEIARKLKV
jgi:hypothetical protein